jgi:hypothetical protein
MRNIYFINITKSSVSVWGLILFQLIYDGNEEQQFCVEKCRQKKFTI